MKSVFFAFILIFVEQASAQVCSPPGQLCAGSSDCCRGCCEQYTCVERPFPCTADLIQQPGANTCRNFFCPPHHICYLREVCPPENPCPRQPSCRPVGYNNNHSFYYPRNGSSPCFSLLVKWIHLLLVAISLATTTQMWFM